MSNQNWCHSSDGENFSSCTFKTRTEAIADAEACYCDGYTREYYLGQAEDYVPCIDVDAVIEQISEDAYDYTDDYLEHVSHDDKTKLEQQFNKVFWEWAKETGNEPTFGRVEKIEKITIGAGEQNGCQKLHSRSNPKGHRPQTFQNGKYERAE